MAYLIHNQMSFYLMSCGLFVKQCVFTTFGEKTNDIFYIVRWGIKSPFFTKNTLSLGLFI